MSLADSDFVALEVQGYVVYHNVPEHEAEAWRRDVRKVARQQGWKIRTGTRAKREQYGRSGRIGHRKTLKRMRS